MLDQVLNAFSNLFNKKSEPRLNPGLVRETFLIGEIVPGPNGSMELTGYIAKIGTLAPDGEKGPHDEQELKPFITNAWATLVAPPQMNAALKDKLPGNFIDVAGVVRNSRNNHQTIDLVHIESSANTILPKTSFDLEGFRLISRYIRNKTGESLHEGRLFLDRYFHQLPPIIEPVSLPKAAPVPAVVQPSPVMLVPFQPLPAAKIQPKPQPVQRPQAVQSLYYA